MLLYIRIKALGAKWLDAGTSLCAATDNRVLLALCSFILKSVLHFIFQIFVWNSYNACEDP